MTEKEKLAYLAGLIDGEGSIYLQKTTNKNGNIRYDMRFNITNTNQILCKWLQENFGGLVYSRKGCNERCKPRFEWVASRKLFDILSIQILPFLTIKKPQVELAIQFRKTFTKINKKPSIDLVNFREECFHKMRSLNKKGV